MISFINDATFLTAIKGGLTVPEKSISEQIIDEFIDNIEKAEIIDNESLTRMKAALGSDKPKKADILKAIGGSE